MNTSKTIHTPSPAFRFEPLFLLCVLSIAAILIFKNIGSEALWFDEAHTAFLARTTLKYGVPKGIDGRNTVSVDETGQDTDMTKNGTWILTPWLPYYMIAPLTKLDPFKSEGILRTPFALFGLATILFSYFLSKRFFQTKVAMLTAVFFVFFVPFLLYSRQCRYYTLAMFFSVWLLYGYDKFLKGEKGVFKHVLLSQALLFYSNYLIWASIMAGIALHFFLVSYDKRKVNDFVLLAVYSVLFHLPWIMLFKSKAIHSFVSPEMYINNVGDYLLKINNNLAPLSLFLIWYYVTLPKAKRSWTLVWRGRNQSIEMNRLFLIVALVLGAVMMMSFSKYVFFRYLVGVLPLTIIARAYFSYEIFLRKKVLGSILMVTLVFTDFLTFPFKVLSTPATFVETKDGKRKFSPVLDKAHLPFFDYLYEISRNSKDPNKEIMKFLREHAKPDDRVLTSTGYISILYYLPQLELNGGGNGRREYLARSMERMNQAEWLIPKNTSTAAGGDFNAHIQMLLGRGGYERYELDVMYHDENMPEPEAHIFDYSKVPVPPSPVEIYKKKHSRSEIDPWEEISQ